MVRRTVEMNNRRLSGIEEAGTSNQADYGSIVPLSHLVSHPTSNLEVRSINLDASYSMQPISTNFPNVSHYNALFQGTNIRSPPLISPEGPNDVFDRASASLASQIVDRTRQLNRYVDTQISQFRSQMEISEEDFASGRAVLDRRLAAEQQGLTVPRFAPVVQADTYVEVGPDPIIRIRAPSARKSQVTKERKVYVLSCKDCDNLLCYRGMRALLLANKRRALYSTDSPFSKYIVCLF